ncbi:MAG: cupin domain-containing protein [Formosimonas sp.]
MKKHFQFVNENFVWEHAHGSATTILSSRIISSNTGSLFSWVDYVEIPLGSSIGLHQHSMDDEELYIVLEGRGIVTLGQGHYVEVLAGDVIRNPPGGEHGLRNTGAETMRLVVVDVRRGSA